MQQVTGNVYVETGYPGCNTSIVVTSEGTVVIDTPMVPALAREWAAEAGKHGPVRYVIDGEPHTDHIAGNCWFGAPVIAVEGVREWIAKLTPADLEGELSWMAPDALPLDSEFRYRLPEISYRKEMKLNLGNHTFELYGMPGHTPFNSAVYVPEEKVLFTSDNVAETMPIMVHCVPEWLDTLQRLQAFDADYVVYGHGSVGSKDTIRKTSESVSYCFDEVKAAIARGWNADEACERITFSDRFPSIPGDPLTHVRKMGIARMYELFKK